MSDRINVTSEPGSVVAGPWPQSRRNDSTSGGGDEPPMEHRLSEVEKAIVRIDGRFELLGSKLESIGTTVANFKWQLFAAVVAVFLAVIATGIAIQQMTVATFQAAANASADASASLSSRQQPTPIIINVPAAAGLPAPPASK